VTTPDAAIITGAGAGLGRAIAQRLAADGYRVAVADIDREGADESVRLIAAAGGEGIAVTLDVSNAKACTDAVAETVAAFGSVDALVNNAGIGRASRFIDISEELWDAVQDVNVKGTFLMCQAVARGMIERRRGAIVNMSSIAGKDGFPMWSHYVTSKHAVIGLTRALARELGPDGIRVNAICPGAIRTAIWSAEAQGTDDPDAIFDALAARTALGRGQTPEDIAAAIAFLLGAEAANITGIALTVDSGLLCD
jgi:NAD(P)-dependent dehydrogenase (short-subunit alcohol dehydrogenase family)